MFVKNLDLKPRGPRCRGMTCEIERKLNSCLYQSGKTRKAHSR